MLIHHPRGPSWQVVAIEFVPDTWGEVQHVGSKQEIDELEQHQPVRLKHHINGMEMLPIFFNNSNYYFLTFT